VPMQLSSYGNWSYLGCYTDFAGTRALKNYIHIPHGNLTEEICMDNCLGYKYAGMEYGMECWCDDEIGGHSRGPVSAGCITPCKGTNSHYFSLI
jgi:hypothetical protein